MPNLSGYIEERIKRGTKRMEAQRGMRNLCLEFARGNMYLRLGADGKLYDAQRAQVEFSPEDEYRIHSRRNLLLPIINGKVSAATQRIPNYEVLPSTFDPEDIAGANIGEKVMLAGYDQWRIRRAAQKAVYYAVVADEAYAMVYWDPNLGPYRDVGGEYVGEGDVRIRVFNANQVMSEPGIDFEESAWYGTQYARPIDELKRDPDFAGVELTADADTNMMATKKPGDGDNLVIVTDYYERPCPKYPNGRWLSYANKKQIFEEADYPAPSSEGVRDEPCLHRLSYIIDPDQESDQGLVRHLIDPLRTYLDANNKALELKNLALVLQVMAPRGAFATDRLDNTPGKIHYYDLMPGQPEPKFREAPDPALIGQLHEIADRAKSDIGFISDANDIPSQVESAKGIQALVEKDQLAWQRFIGDLADWHSRLGRDCLTHVQDRYTEPRLLRYRGRMGWQPIENFRGADLHNQTDVRVLPGSLESKTKTAIEQKILAFADRGWITPEQAMSAINGGTAEALIDTYEKDIARANLILQKIDRGPEVLFATQPRPVFPGEDAGWEVEPVYGEPEPTMDETGQLVMGEPPIIEEGIPATEVPGWMPRPFDNAQVQQTVVEDFLKSPAYDRWTPDQQDAVHQYYAALLDIEAKNAARAQAMQIQTAQDLGMANATRPPTAGTPQQLGAASAA